MKHRKNLVLVVLSLLIVNTSPLRADAPATPLKKLTPVNEISFEDFRPENIFSYNFGFWIPDSLTYKDFYFVNKSEWPLEIRNIAIAGPAFAAIHQCPAKVETGYRCLIRMIFRPAESGANGGQMVIQTDRGPIVVALNGWGY
jgi:hypothetical protein